METRRQRRPEGGRMRDFLLIRVTGHVHDDIERGAIGIFIALRLSDIVATALALPNASSSSSNAPLFFAFTACVAIFTACMCVSAWRAGGLTAYPWGYADYVVAIASIGVTSALFPPAEQFGSWLVWGPGFAIGTAVAVGFWAGTPRRALALGAGLGVTYTLIIAWDSHIVIWSVLANASNYMTVAFVASWIAGYLRALARETERAREQAIAAQAELERERYRLLVHDATGVLQLLADESTPEIMQDALRQQALTESSKLRSFLTDPIDGGDDGEHPTIGSLIAEAIAGFRDLPLELAVDLAARVRLEREDATAVMAAIVTTLHNVRNHAEAHLVVIHADERNGHWEISIRDDGIGFDMAVRPLGFGLSRQVIGALAERDIKALVESEPHHGTSVTMQGSALVPADVRVPGP